MPRRLRPTAGRRRRGLVLALGADEIVVAERAADGLRTLGSVDAAAPDRDERLRALLRQAKRRGRRPATVRLAPDLGLRKTLELPLAARDDLDQLLRFEMDRLTPFRAEEVHFAQQVLATDAAGRRLTVELQAAPRRVVEQALETARVLGLRPARVELAADDAGGAEPLNLLGDQPGGGARESRVNRALVLLALLLLVIAVAIPLRRQQARLAELENQVAAARAEAEDEPGAARAARPADQQRELPGRREDQPADGHRGRRRAHPAACPTRPTSSSSSCATAACSCTATPRPPPT